VPRVIFDTVVFVRALINPRSHCGQILFEHFSGYRLFVSRAIIEEILEVFGRAQIISKFNTLKNFDLTAVLDIVAAAELVEPSIVARASRDPGDDKFLAAASTAGAAFLVSEDQDLLVLRTYEDTAIVSCEEFVAVLAKSS
jgi:putative PIN family toxin of toxin-antitoxin system